MYGCNLSIKFSQLPKQAAGFSGQVGFTGVPHTPFVSPAEWCENHSSRKKGYLLSRQSTFTQRSQLCRNLFITLSMIRQQLLKNLTRKLNNWQELQIKYFSLVHFLKEQYQSLPSSRVYQYILSTIKQLAINTC